MSNLIHALPDANGGRQMKNNLDTAEGAVNRASIPDVAFQELGFGGKMWGPRDRAVHLRIEFIEHPDNMAGLQQMVGQMRTDESCASNDQYTFAVHLRILSEISS